MDLDRVLPASFAAALLLVVLFTPVVSLAAWRAGLVDRGSDERRLHRQPTPRLGGLAILAAVALPSIALGRDHGLWGILLGASMMALVGAVDDVAPLPPAAKLAGQLVVATITVWFGVRIDDITLPVVEHVHLGVWGYPATVLWIVAITNTVNFLDGMDGLAAGFCGIATVTFAVLAASLGHGAAAAVSAIVAGATLGFLRYNFPPASIFMGDSGALMLGYLLAAVAVEGVLKTAAAVALVFPLVVMALPIMDTSFVVLKRLKYKRPIYVADRNHFHHRFATMGWGQRRALLVLYGWCGTLSAFALAVRFVPHRHAWTPAAIAALSAFGLVALAASVYVIYLLEILKLRRLQFLARLRRAPAPAPAAADREPEGVAQRGPVP